MEFDIFFVYAFSAIGLLLALAMVYCVFNYPRAGIATGFLLVFIANTRLRLRDPTAALAGDIDGQVVMELGLYGSIGLIAAVVIAKCRIVRPAFSPIEGVLGLYVTLCLLSFEWSLAPTLTLSGRFSLRRSSHLPLDPFVLSEQTAHLVRSPLFARFTCSVVQR